MAVSGDLISDACDRLAELAPGLDRTVLERVERELRIAYGGSMLYVREKRARDIAGAIEQINPDVSVSVQARDLGLSRKTIYRHLRNRSASRKRQSGGGL